MITRLNKKIFTLVELIIVVVIIGILAAALLPKLTGAQAKARDTARKADLNQLNTALSSYYNDEGQYTGAGCVDDLKTALIPRYINSIPRDPQKNRKMIYTTSGACATVGSYGILPIFRNGSQNGGVILAAKVETDGKAANFVLAQSGNVNIKKSSDISVGAFSDASSCIGSSSSNVECFSSNLEGTTLEPNLCRDGVQVATAGAGAGSSGCDTDSKGNAKVNEAMIYIVTQ